MGLKWGHLQHSHVSKEVPKRHHYGEIPQTLSRNSTCWGTSLKCLNTNACSMGNKHNELDICVQLQGCNLVGIMEMRWGGSHDWSIAMEGYRLIRKDRQGRRGGVVALYVRAQLECMELCLQMDKDPVESLWVRIKERTGQGDIIVGVCYRPPD